MNNIVGRTTFYKLLKSPHIKKHKALNVLCDNCFKNGFTNLDNLNSLLDEFGQSFPSDKIEPIKKRLKNLHVFFRTKLASHLNYHYQTTELQNFRWKIPFILHFNTLYKKNLLGIFSCDQHDEDYYFNLLNHLNLFNPFNLLNHLNLLNL